MIGFLVRLMALVLSHLKGMCSKCNPKSESCCLSHKIYAQQLLAAMYSALTIDKATHACFSLFQDDAVILRKRPITRAMSKRLQEDWARATEEGPRVLMNLRVGF